jgi:hypothetical protein
MIDLDRIYIAHDFEKNPTREILNELRTYAPDRQKQIDMLEWYINDLEDAILVNCQ